MKVVGNISKLKSEHSSPVSYSLPVGDKLVSLDPPNNKNILSLNFTGKINCVACNRAIKKSYQQGYCFVCTQKLAQCDLCVLKPERCHYHLGTCREPEWGDSHCMIPHIVYISNTSGVKVGITRTNQVPTRWIDQGAVAALPLFKVATRRVSGYVEVFLAQFVDDKTNWRKMLKNEVEDIDLKEVRQDLLAKFEGYIHELSEQFSDDAFEIIKQPKLCKIQYPVIKYPTKVSSLNFDKTPKIEGQLLGIKGQYLIFEQGVLNIRKFGGYELEVSV